MVVPAALALDNDHALLVGLLRDVLQVLGGADLAGVDQLEAARQFAQWNRGTGNACF